MINALRKLGLHWLASSSIPPGWLYDAVLPVEKRSQKQGRLRIEIVSHCWQYSRLLSYQLNSLVQNAVQDADIIMTVFYSKDDRATQALLDMVSNIAVANVTWNWQPLPSSQLFRRSIGRNLAALNSQADWVWFTDCDMTFQSGCLDSLNKALQRRQDALVFPAVEHRTDIHTESDLISSNSLDQPELLEASSELFSSHSINRATGPLQITHGDVARANGYCRDVPFYQQPAEHFQKATEDRLFRWLLGTQGTPIDVIGVCRIQHVDKGRYQKDSTGTRWRKQVRRWQYAWRQKFH